MAATEWNFSLRPRAAIGPPRPRQHDASKKKAAEAKLREAGVPNVVVWRTTLDDAPAKLFAVRFWEVIAARSPSDNDSLRTAVRAAFEAGKVAVQTAVKPGGAIDVGDGRRRDAAVELATRGHAGVLLRQPLPLPTAAWRGGRSCSAAQGGGAQAQAREH